MDALSDWLADLDLERYIDVFAENDVDFDAVRLLSDSDLEKLGVSLGHRRKLLRAIDALNSSSVTTSAALPIEREKSPESSTALEGERRQLTVLFCDMVGFTELANRVDPEVLREIIRSYEDACAVCVSRYEGYVFQRLGDGIVAFFGYPLAHEGEAERAIRAAMQIVESLSGLEVADVGHLAVRIGIATGLVVVSSADKSAVGETMNLASRLQGIAPVGSIVVSERVHRLAGGSFDYEDLGEQALKGISRPTHAFRILGPSAAASRFEAATQEGLTPLVGREPEIGHLVERWQLAREGEGQVVLLSGEPGIGKSRILSALRERLQNEVKGTLRFQCSPYYGNSAFYPIIDNFERALQFGRDEAAGSKLDKLEALVVRQRGRPLADVRFIASILSIPTDERYGPLPMTPQKQKDETIRVLVDLTEAAARREPSLMLFEDAHWADPTTLEVLDLLIERIRQVPLLVVITHRPEFQSRWPGREHVTTLNLSKLTRLQSSAMVSKLAGGKALPAELHEQIIAKTDGVPLFVEELTKSVLESTVLRDAGDHYVYAGAAGAVTIPATLRDSLMARLDRFMPVKEIAQIGAAIGREFSYELIAAVAPMTQTHLDDGLRRLTESGLAFRRGTPPEATYTFKHALVQDAAYDSLLKSRRVQLHAQIAQTLAKDFSDRVANKPELLAHHYTQAGLHERAVPYWLLAGQRALARVALAEAVAHLTTALSVNERLPASVERDHGELEIRVLLGTTYLAFLGWLAIQVPQVLAPARTLAIRLGQADKLVPVLFYIWFHHAMRCEYSQSLQAIDELDALARSRDDSTALVTARMTEALTQGWMGKFKQARQTNDLLLRVYKPEKHGHLVHIYNHDPSGTGVFAGHWIWALGYPDQAKKAALEQLELARRLGHAFNLCWALTGGTLGLLLRGEADLVRKWIAEGDALARQHAITIITDVIAPNWDGYALIALGECAVGYAKSAPTLSSWRNGGGLHMVPFGCVMLGKALTGLRRFDEARGLLDEALQLIHKTGHRMDEAEVHRMLGVLLHEQFAPDLRAAEASFLKALEVARSQEAKGFELRAAISLARLWQNQSKRKHAHDLLAPIYNWFTEGFDTKDLTEAKALLDELG